MAMLCHDGLVRLGFKNYEREIGQSYAIQCGLESLG